MITITEEKMKDKIITIKVDGAAPGQWSSLLLELNLMKQAWKPYGVDITIVVRVKLNETSMEALWC